VRREVQEDNMKIATRLGILVLALLVIGITSSCQQQCSEPAAPQVDVAAMKAALLAAWNDGDIDQYDTICTPGIVAHEGGSQRNFEGLEAVKDWITAVRTGYPDFHWTIDDVIVAGDKMTLLWSWTGTNTGPSPGGPDVEPLPATGKTVSNSGVAVIHLVDGKINESWSFYDMASQQLQLGFTITPPEATEL
jgi:steroid delta-isomerase-like uncharacterized protein